MTPTPPRPRRGEIWWVDFDPAVGSEQRKTRPALVLSSDSVGRLPLKIVVPVTDWKEDYAQVLWFVELRPTSKNGLAKPSGADAFQVKSLSIQRFKSRMGVVTAEQLEDVASAVAICVGAP